MKKILLMASVLSLSFQSLAVPVELTRVLKNTTTKVALELNEQSVFCTDLGYSNIQLKVSVPQLDWLAHFDHRVVGESAPCITGGRCSATLQPGSIIDPNNPFEIVPIRVNLQETTLIDFEARTCDRYLTETVTSKIRGTRFTHVRYGELPKPKFEICEKEVNL